MKINLWLLKAIILFFLFSCDAPKNSVTLYLEQPVTINCSTNSHYIIIEDVRINNDKEFRNLIFDTGSNGTVIDKSIAKELNLLPVGKTRLIDITGKKKRVPYVKIDSINISGAVFKNIYALVTDLSMYECERAEIILGNNVLKRGLWQIDLESNIITLYNREEKFDFSEYRKIPFSFRINLIKIQFELNKKKYRNVLFDTGNPAYCVLLKKKDKDGFKALPVSTWKYLYRSINHHQSDTLYINFFLLHGFELNDNISMDSIYSRFSRKRSVGLGLFQDNQIVIDYKRKVIGLKMNLTQIDSKTKNVGLAFSSFDKVSVLVSAIKLGSSADVNGVMLGDTVEMVNNICTDKLQYDYCTLLDTLNTHTTDTLYLKTRNNDDVITILPQ